MITDFVSPDQFGEYSDADLADSPPRPTMNGEHMGPQFAGLVGAPDDAPPAGRHPNYVGAQTVHQYRTSPGSASNG